MPKGEPKVKTIFILNNDIFSFMYDIKTITLSQFLDPGLFYTNNFQTDIIEVVEIQIHS